MVRGFLLFLLLRLKLFRKISQKLFPSSFSIVECEVGKLLSNGRKTANGSSDVNNNRNGFVSLESEPLALSHVGKSLRYESKRDCGTLFCLVVS